MLYKLGELAARGPGDYWAEVEQSGTTTIFRSDSGELVGVVVRSGGKELSNPDVLWATSNTTSNTLTA